MNHHINTPEPDPEGIDWATLDAEVRWENGYPTPADIAAAQGLDPDADADLWPQVIDAKGKPTGESARPNPAAMHAALMRAAAVNPAEVEFLANTISQAEARSIIDQAARQRGHERALAAEVAERRTDLAATDARRQVEHDARMAEAVRRRENRAERALERRSRALDPTGRVVRLAAAERLVPWIAVVPAVLAAVLGAVNVGVQLDVLSPSTHAINWLVEPLLTLPLLAILAAQILGAIPSGGNNPYRRLEWALIAVAVGLNVGLHVAADDGWSPSAAVWAIVPAGLAISMHLVPRLIRQVRTALAEAGDDATGAAAATSAAPRASYATVGPTSARGSARGSAQGPPPQVAGSAGVPPLERLIEAVQAGQIDPGRSGNKPIDPTSAASIARTLRIRESRAAELRDEYQDAVNRTE